MKILQLSHTSIFQENKIWHGTLDMHRNELKIDSLHVGYEADNIVADKQAEAERCNLQALHKPLHSAYFGNVPGCYRTALQRYSLDTERSGAVRRK